MTLFVKRTKSTQNKNSLIDLTPSSLFGLQLLEVKCRGLVYRAATVDRCWTDFLLCWCSGCEASTNRRLDSVQYFL